MLNKMAISLAQSFYAQSGNKYDEDDIELYAYGLVSFLSTIFEIFAVLLWGIIVGRMFETISFFVSFIPLRSFAGGYHARTIPRCFLILLIIYALNLAVIRYTPYSLTNYVSLMFLSISAFPILKYSPVADVNKPIGPIQRKEFRKKSLIIFFSQALIIVIVGGFCMITSKYGLVIAEKIPYICLSFAIGQLTASGSLVAAKIHRVRGGAINEC